MHLKIVADAHVWGVNEAFCCFEGYDVELDVREASCIDAQCLADADVLISRSSLKINATLLADSSLRFVGTATVGDDHVDQAFLASQGIVFASAAGSSTGSVLEYMLAALLYWQQKQQRPLHQQTLGIIGVGRIGSALADCAKQLGMKVLLCDPPRMRQEDSNVFVSMHDVLEQADIVTLHTPLHRQGLDKTWHLLDDVQLSRFKGHTLINAARGSVVSQDALLAWLEADVQHQAILDCWEHEPNISQPLLRHAGLQLGTAHIAGHSLEGKAANTFYVYKALCEHLGVAHVWQANLSKNTNHVTVQHKMCYEDVKPYYDIEQDSKLLHQSLHLLQSERAQQFKYLRRYYPVRRSWLKWQ